MHVTSHVSGGLVRSQQLLRVLQRNLSVLIFRKKVLALANSHHVKRREVILARNLIELFRQGSQLSTRHPLLINVLRSHDQMPFRKLRIFPWSYHQIARLILKLIFLFLDFLAQQRSVSLFLIHPVHLVVGIHGNRLDTLD